MASINPYITFKDNCREAFEFYRSVLGGDFANLMTMGDTQADCPMPEGTENLIMHVALPYGDSMLMGSDSPEGFGPPLSMGNNITVAIAADSREEADRIYAGLSNGGDQTMPMADAFWGDYFGMLTDKFGINWMINVLSNQ